MWQTTSLKDVQPFPCIETNIRWLMQQRHSGILTPPSPKMWISTWIIGYDELILFGIGVETTSDIPSQK